MVIATMLLASAIFRFDRRGDSRNVIAIHRASRQTQVVGATGGCSGNGLRSKGRLSHQPSAAEHATSAGTRMKELLPFSAKCQGPGCGRASLVDIYQSPQTSNNTLASNDIAVVEPINAPSRVNK